MPRLPSPVRLLPGALALLQLGCAGGSGPLPEDGATAGTPAEAPPVGEALVSPPGPRPGPVAAAPLQTSAAGECPAEACSACTPEEGGAQVPQDASPPGPAPLTLLGAAPEGEARLRVRFSRAVAPSTLPGRAVHLASYCVERADDTPTLCTPAAEPVLAAVRQAAPDTVDLVLSGTAVPGGYTLLVTGVRDEAGGPLGSPNWAHFELGVPTPQGAAGGARRTRARARPQGAPPAVPAAPQRAADANDS